MTNSFLMCSDDRVKIGSLSLQLFLFHLFSVSHCLDNFIVHIFRFFSLSSYYIIFSQTIFWYFLELCISLFIFSSWKPKFRCCRLFRNKNDKALPAVICWIQSFACNHSDWCLHRKQQSLCHVSSTNYDFY